MRRAARAMALSLAGLWGSLPALAEEFTGRPTVVDTDTLAFGSTRIMLFGIESVERGQPCAIGGVAWACEPAAVRALETITGGGDVACTTVGPPDAFGRFLGTCTIAGVDVNDELVRQGFALAKRDETLDYVPAEDAAKAAKIGLWQGEFETPRAFRTAHDIIDARDDPKPR